MSPYEDTGYDVYEDDAAYGDEPAYGDEEYGDDAEIFGDGDDGFIEEDAYADAPEDVADPYAEDDLYADAPEDEADPYAEDDLYADAPGYLYQGDDLYANAPGYVADPYEEEDQNADPYAEDDPYAYGPGEVEGPEEAFVEGPVEVTDVQGPAAGPEEVAGVPSAAGELTFEGFAAYPGSDYVPAFENLVLSQVCPTPRLPSTAHLPLLPRPRCACIRVHALVCVPGSTLAPCFLPGPVSAMCETRRPAAEH